MHCKLDIASSSKVLLASEFTVFGKTTENWLVVDFARWSYENDYFSALKFAILKWRVVSFDYYNLYRDKTIRRVEPLQLWFKANARYLKGFCLTKQGMRLYKSPRIKNLTVTNEMFDKRATHDIAINPVEGIYGDRALHTIRLRIEPERAYRVYDDFYGGEAAGWKLYRDSHLVDWQLAIWLYPVFRKVHGSP